MNEKSIRIMSKPKITHVAKNDYDDKNTQQVHNICYS